MKIYEFVEAYKKMQNKSTASVSKLIEAKEYVPILRKKYLAELIYNASTALENNVVKVDSLSKYMMFTMLMITEYTNLEFSVDDNGAATEEAIDEYDVLCHENLLNPIIECFAEDYARANEVLNYVFKDNLAASNNVEAVLGRVSVGLLNIVDGLAMALQQKAEEFNLEIPDVDAEAVAKLVDLLKGVDK